MTRFWREGHWRTGSFGDDHWVEGHWVHRTEWNRASYSAEAQRSFVYRPRLTYESFTRPTRCSYCGADVFFVQHNGGRVFFNELGWPWDDKHECLGPIPKRNLNQPERTPPPKAAPFRWQQEGWVPINIDRIVREDAWHVLKCTRLHDGQLVRLLVLNDPGDLRRIPAISVVSRRC